MIKQYIIKIYKIPRTIW